MHLKQRALAAALIIGTAVSGGIAAGGSASATTAPSDPKTLNTVTLSKTVSLPDADKLAETSSLNVVGYRFETVGVVGEFYKSSSVDEFLGEFKSRYGTAPEVTALLVAESAKTVARSAPARTVLDVPADVQEYKAKPSTSGSAWQEMAETRSQSDALRPAATARAAVAQTWQPSFAQYGTLNQGTKSVLFQRFVWDGQAGSSPLNRDLQWGLEFEMNLVNKSVPAGARPICHLASDPTQIDPNYRQRFWAQNRNYDWELFYTNGQSPSALGAYADTNDQFDLCTLQSMAVGLRNPGLLNSAGSTKLYELGIRISAPRGTTGSAIATNIQHVEALSCKNAPWNGKISTDCMGLNQKIAPNAVDPSTFKTMGNISRGFSAPNTCWNTYLQKTVGPDGTNDTVHKFDCSLLGS